MKSVLFIGILSTFLVFSLASSLYDDQSSEVVNLTPTTFNSRVLESEDIWFVEFYAPWCGHCKSLAPEYSKAASALKGIVKIGGVNADEYGSLGEQYKVQGFPTIKIFSSNKKSPLDYNGPRTAQGIIDAAFKEMKSVVDKRLGGGGKRSSSKEGKKGSDKDVIELTDSNFEEMVLDSKDMWLVEFMAPWCGHCQRLTPEWAQAASELKGQVKLGVVDATVHTITAGKYSIKGFPTIKYFPAGKKFDPEEYDGGRTASDIVNWASEKAASSAPAPELVELINEDSIKQACENSQLCTISILPQLLDCQSECRNKYLETLKQLAEKFKRNRWGWLWTEAMAQPRLEESLGIGGFGYPAMAVLNYRKMKYSLLRGSFSYDGINDSLKAVAVGRGYSVPMPDGKLPKIVETQPWDGKDEEVPTEDEIDLSDVVLDDMPSSHSEL